MKFAKLLKFFTGLLFAGGLFLATITGGAHVVGKINEIGEIPEGKAGEIAGYLLQWDAKIKEIWEKYA